MKSHRAILERLRWRLVLPAGQPWCAVSQLLGLQVAAVGVGCNAAVVAGDILDYVPEPPALLVGSVGADSSPITAADAQIQGDLSVPQAGSADGDLSSHGLVYGLIVVGVLAAAALAGFLFWRSSERADIAVDGVEIANAQAVISQAEVLYLNTMEADGAVLTGDERCFFAGRGSTPDVLCGPGWLGQSPTEEPWLEMDVEYELLADAFQGTVVGVDGSNGAEVRTFSRPDGRGSAPIGERTFSPLGPRTGRGSLVVDPAAVVAAADLVFAEAVTNPNPVDLSLSNDARCFLVESTDSHGGTVVADRALCGPMRTFNSDIDDLWAEVSLRWSAGTTFGSAVIETAQVSAGSTASGFRPRKIPEDSVLIRPDGLVPAPAGLLDRPPRLPDLVAAYPAALGADLAGSGRLVADDYSINFTGFGRADRLGEGHASVIAAPGYEFAVAGHVAGGTRTSFAPRGVLLVDGTERPLPTNWRVGEEPQLLVVSVPTGTSTVALVIENNGRPQTISLDDGSLEPGFPLALYRDPLELSDPIAARVEMPIGEAVLVSGALQRLDWSAKSIDGEWLPVGQSRLGVELDRFQFDRPCCDVSVDDIVTSLVLIDADSGDEIPNARPEDDGRDPFFLVDEAIEDVTLRFEFVVTYTVDDEPQEAQAIVEIEVLLP